MDDIKYGVTFIPKNIRKLANISFHYIESTLTAHTKNITFYTRIHEHTQRTGIFLNDMRLERLLCFCVILDYNDVSIRV